MGNCSWGNIMKRPPFKLNRINPALNNTHVENDRATNTNSEVWASYPVDYPGPSVLVPRDTIIAARKADKNTTLAPDGLGMVCGGVTMSFKGPDPNDWLDAPTIETYPVQLPGFAAAVKRVSYAAAREDVRYYINGVVLQVASDAIHVVATDGHRLEFIELPPVPDLRQGEYMFPTECLKFIDSDILRLESLYAQVGDWLITKLVDGTYPRWRRIVPTAKYTAIVDRDEFMTALKTLLPFTDKSYNQVMIEYTLTALKITVGTLSSIKIDATCSSDMTVGYDCSYLIDAIKQCDSVVTIGYTDPSSSILINDTAVVMPIKIVNN